MFQDLEDGEQPSSPVTDELKEMLIKGNYVLYFHSSEENREFYFEKKVEKTEDIPAVKREAFEALTLFKSDITNTKSELDINL